MKRWWIITVALYVLLITLLAIPLLYACFEGPGPADGWLEYYEEEGTWIWIGALGLAQFLLLLVPVRIARERPVARRHILASAIVCALAVAFLLGTAGMSLSVAIFGEQDVGGVACLGWLAVMAISWVFWSVMFFRFYRAQEARQVSERLMRWMLRGSIAELLVAVPSHIIVRQRGDCCAPAVTFFGIATGLSIMLLSFGPAVFFLFAKRFKQLHPRKQGQTAVEPI
jgi:hypothetical protein